MKCFKELSTTGKIFSLLVSPYNPADFSSEHVFVIYLLVSPEFHVFTLNSAQPGLSKQENISLKTKQYKNQLFKPVIVTDSFSCEAQEELQ